MIERGMTLEKNEIDYFRIIQNVFMVRAALRGVIFLKKDLMVSSCRESLWALFIFPTI